MHGSLSPIVRYKSLPVLVRHPSKVEIWRPSTGHREQVVTVPSCISNNPQASKVSHPTSLVPRVGTKVPIQIKIGAKRTLKKQGDNFNGKTLAMTVNAPEDNPFIQVLLKQANDLTLLVVFPTLSQSCLSIKQAQFSVEVQSHIQVIIRLNISF